MASPAVWLEIAELPDADESDALPADRAGLFCHIGGNLFIVLILRSVSYAYESLGASHRAAMWLHFAALLGSFFNIPIAEVPSEQVMSNQVVGFFGMRYEVPVVSYWQGTIIAVNVGGAVIPTLVSIYLLIKNQLWVKGLVATTIVAAIMHWLATPVPGIGIALPVFIPAVITAIVAVVLSRESGKRRPRSLISPAGWAR